jgi:hypothetical protein
VIVRKGGGGHLRTNENVPVFKKALPHDPQ